MEDNIDFDEACDGIFHLIINDPGLAMKEGSNAQKTSPMLRRGTSNSNLCMLLPPLC